MKTSLKLAGWQVAGAVGRLIQILLMPGLSALKSCCVSTVLRYSGALRSRSMGSCTAILEDCNRVIEFLAAKWKSPGRPRDCEYARQMRKVVAAGLRLDIPRWIFGEGDELLAGDLAAFEVAEIAVLDGLENLGLGAEDGISRLGDVVVDDRGERRIFFAVEFVGAFKFCLPFDDPGIGRLFAVGVLGLAVHDQATFLDEDLGGVRRRTVFASPCNYATHRHDMSLRQEPIND